jgi:hypothetical protein
MIYLEEITGLDIELLPIELADERLASLEDLETRLRLCHVGYLAR